MGGESGGVTSLEIIMHKICNKCGNRLLLDTNWTYPRMKARMYVCNECHAKYSNKSREDRQRAKEAGTLELFELDLQVIDLCEKIYHYRKVDKFLYPYVKNHFGLNTVAECKHAIWLLEYNLLVAKNSRRRSSTRSLILRGMRQDPQFNKYMIMSKNTHHDQGLLICEYDTN